LLSYAKGGSYCLNKQHIQVNTNLSSELSSRKRKREYSKTGFRDFDKSASPPKSRILTFEKKSAKDNIKSSHVKNSTPKAISKSRRKEDLSALR
jgi:hypothetical protein